MSYRGFRVAAAVAITSMVAGSAQAQTESMHLGPRLSYQFDLEKIGVGAQLSVPVMKYLEFYPSFDYFFVSNGSYWALNADLKYRIASQSIKWLYVGGGLQIARAGAGNAHDTNAGLNLLAGAESLKGKIHPFAEFRFTAGDGSTGQLSAGLNFTLGKY